jgi:hypothetical protein
LFEKEVAGEKFGNIREEATGNWKTCLIRSSIVWTH